MIDFGPQTYRENPELAIYVASIISTWAVVETNLDLTFIMLVGSGSEGAIEIYRSLTGSGPKDSAMNAVARSKLPLFDYDIYLATRRVLKRIAKQRNDIVHGLIGHSKEIGEALIVLHQSDMFEHMNTLFRRQWLDQNPATSRRSAETRFSEKAFVYREHDLQKVLDRCLWAESISSDLAVLCTEIHHLHIQTRQKLRSDPLISREIAKIDKARGTNKTSVG